MHHDSYGMSLVDPHICSPWCCRLGSFEFGAKILDIGRTGKKEAVRGVVSQVSLRTTCYVYYLDKEEDAVFSYAAGGFPPTTQSQTTANGCRRSTSSHRQFWRCLTALCPRQIATVLLKEDRDPLLTTIKELDEDRCEEWT